MTVRALVLSPEGGHYDHTKTKESLRVRAIRASFESGGVHYVIAVEPMIKKGEDGKLLQTIRVRALDGSSVESALGKTIVLDGSNKTISVG